MVCWDIIAAILNGILLPLHEIFIAEPASQAKPDPDQTKIKTKYVYTKTWKKEKTDKKY